MNLKALLSINWKELALNPLKCKETVKRKGVKFLKIIVLIEQKWVCYKNSCVLKIHFFPIFFRRNPIGVYWKSYNIKFNIYLVSKSVLVLQLFQNEEKNMKNMLFSEIMLDRQRIFKCVKICCNIKLAIQLQLHIMAMGKSYS